MDAAMMTDRTGDVAHGGWLYIATQPAQQLLCLQAGGMHMHTSARAASV